MRIQIPIAVLAGPALLLAACGKPATSTDQPAGAPEPAAPPASAPLADARAKAALASLPAAYQSADLDNGQAKFALCKSCHTVAEGGGAMAGPNLWGVFGRKAGTSPGFAYSDGLKASGIVWDAASLDHWIANPHAVVPTTKMTYLGMPAPKDRADVIAYLKVATTP
ncbi:MAG: cytochrome c family protein, partial [Pseudomonadota bacterium]